MSEITKLAVQAVQLLQQQILSLGYSAHIHFEIEGGYRRAHQLNGGGNRPINFAAINLELQQRNIQGVLKPEYWQNQWEYVSDFAGQSPLQEAEHFSAVYRVLPQLLKKYGAQQVYIKPIMWSGDKGRLQAGCSNIFSTDGRPVHIPNAIQMNISASKAGQNVVAVDGFGELLQQHLLQTSLACSLLYLPEQEAFERLTLKQDYGLDAELSSPHEISGGYQGSIALYKDIGKHNQKLGVIPLLFDRHQQVIASEQNWQVQARIEHRLGAASLRYNPYVNVAFGLCNLLAAIKQFESGHYDAKAKAQTLEFCHTYRAAVPASLFAEGENLGAYEIFERSNWFNQSINQFINNSASDLGDQLKQSILNSYRQQIFMDPSVMAARVTTKRAEYERKQAINP